MRIQAVAVQRSAFVVIRCSAELRRADVDADEDDVGQQLRKNYLLAHEVLIDARVDRRRHERGRHHRPEQVHVGDRVRRDEPRPAHERVHDVAREEVRGAHGHARGHGQREAHLQPRADERPVPGAVRLRAQRRERGHEALVHDHEGHRAPHAAERRGLEVVGAEVAEHAHVGERHARAAQVGQAHGPRDLPPLGQLFARLGPPVALAAAHAGKAYCVFLFFYLFTVVALPPPPPAAAAPPH